jgi:hypothetical protein
LRSTCSASGVTAPASTTIAGDEFARLDRAGGEAAEAAAR